MMSRRRKSKPGGVSEEIRRRHAWLDLLQTSGPFLALPVVHRVFPSGLPVVPGRQRRALRALVAEMLADKGASRHTVIETMLRDVLDWQDHLLIDTGIPAHLTEFIAGYGTALRPDFAFHADTEPAEDDEEDPDEDDDDAEDADPSDATDLEGTDDDQTEWRLLGTYIPWGQHPLTRTTTGGVTASAVDRLAALLRSRRVPVGLTTNGLWWAIVWAPIGGTTGAAIWDASRFSEEPQFFEAFVAFLNRARFLAVERKDTLARLLLESLERQEEVTEALGAQVRNAVEMLVAKIDQLDRDSGGRILQGVDDDEFYAGVVTVMMRVVFLLFAEERRLLPSDDDIYVAGYSVGYLVDQLDKRASYSGDLSLTHRTAAWHRLLAVTRAVHSGVAHENLRLPAYGGELFDPDRYRWLEGRRSGETVSAAEPPAVDDLTVLRILKAVQNVELNGESRRLTFRALDVEQIGYVYEGLLELEVRTATQTMLSLPRPTNWPRIRKNEVNQQTCEVPLQDVIDRQHALGREDALAAWLSEYTIWKAPKIQLALTAEPTSEQRNLLERVVGGINGDYQAIEPLLGLVRVDQRGLPAVTLPGGRYITRSTRRASSGTHYTPRRLAEEVVRHALEPLVKRPGPLETADETLWELRPSTEIRDLRVADIAMGSGAFLVAACRYLADQLVQAWEREGRHDALRVAQQQAGQRIASDSEIDEVTLKARRLIAEHCLYGVDINPLAVSMAKLSLWLITMDRERPFGFLDDRLICGDSLLGLVTVDQLEALHIDPAEGRRLHQGTLDLTASWRARLQRAADLRRRITAVSAITIRDIEHKARLLEEASQVEGPLATVANALTATGLSTAAIKGKKQDNAFIALSFQVSSHDEELTALHQWAETQLQADVPAGTDRRQPLHWPLAFPEVFADTQSPGFDAILGNPPYLGGQILSGGLGKNYLSWLQRWDGNAVKGSADLAARFLLRAERLLGRRGQLGFVTINSLAETVTLKVGMEQFVKRMSLRRAQSSHAWPTASANVSIVEIWASRIKPSSTAALWLDGEEVPTIGPDLEVVGTVPGRPVPLQENEGRAFIGSYILGKFTLTGEEREELTGRDPRNNDLIHRYVVGKDLSQRPDCSGSRWVIDFGSRSLEEADEYPDLIGIVRRLVKPQRDKNSNRQRREIWWRFTRPAPELYAAIANLDHVLAMSLVGNTLLPARCATGPVFAHKCVVFAMDSFGDLALLSSSIHSSWVIRHTSTMRTDLNYSPSAVFATFPRPKPTADLEKLGKDLDESRRDLMLDRGWGLTTVYNMMRDESVRDAEVQALREIHADIDRAVLDAYGWPDVDPQVGFHKTKIGVRWTLGKEARFEVLDRLRVENQRRFDLEGR